MTIRSLGLAAIALACSAGIAPAQEAAATPQALGALLHQGVLQGGGKAPGATGNATAALSSGWNLQHCYTSVWYTPGGSTSYIYAFNIEGTYFYASSGLTNGGGLAANTLLHLCDTGQLYGVYVTDTSTGAYTHIQSKW